MDRSKKHDRPDDSNKSNKPSADEQRTADETILMLERESTAEISQTQSQKDACLLGEAIRTSATSELPESNGDLRELLVANLDTERSDSSKISTTSQSDKTEPATVVRAPLAGVTGRSNWRSFVAIAGTTLAIGGLGYLIWAESQKAAESNFFAESISADDSVNLSGGSDISGSIDLAKFESKQREKTYSQISAQHDGSTASQSGEILPFVPNLSLIVTEESSPQSNHSGQAQLSQGSQQGGQEFSVQAQSIEMQLSGKQQPAKIPPQGFVTRGGQSAPDRLSAQPSQPWDDRGGFGSGSGGSGGRKGVMDLSSIREGDRRFRSADAFNYDYNYDNRGGNGFGEAVGGIDFGGVRRYQNGENELKEFYDSEQYARINDNPFRKTIGLDRVSTFSIDVDTASYANVRRFINNGQAVPADAVRIEEMVNYFNYEYEQPTDDKPFAVNMEMATCPWNEQHKLLRVGLKGKEIHQEERPASNIVFLLDVSGSMSSNDKLPLLKSGVQMMVNQLTENDRVSIVTYAGNAGVVLEPTPGNQKQKILDAIRNLNAAGSTNGSAGIQLAYELAQKNFVDEGTNKVILATDGDLNVGVTSDEALVDLITGKAKEGVFLTVLGFGTGNLKDGKLEKLADKGNGIYAYIDGVREAHKVLVEGISGTLVTIAKDVKIQIEFNPNEVKSYRLIGYENRILAREDFDNDAKDAGEIGAGHTVTALYELVTTDAPTQELVVPKGLKYQQADDESGKEGDSGDSNESGNSNVYDGELLTLALRYKQPEADESQRIEFTLQNEDKPFSTTSQDFRFASSVAAFGMILRSSPHRGEANLTWVRETAEASTGADLSGYRKEFIDLVRRKNQAR